MKAKSYALRLLKLRPRATGELIQKLELKGYAHAAIDPLIDELTRAGFLDDAAFALAWMRSRLNRPHGLRRITRELSDKGIDRDLIQSSWEDLRQDYDELNVVRALAQKRLNAYPNIDPMKRKKRVMDYLARRGFNLDTIMKVIKEL